MDITWSYMIILVLYAIVLILKYVSNKQTQHFKDAYQTHQVYPIYKKDFFHTIAATTTVIALVINGLALITGHALNFHVLVIMVLLISAATLSGRTQLVVADDICAVDGLVLTRDQMKHVAIREKAKRAHYELTLNEPINGYDSIVFASALAHQEALETYLINPS